MIRITAITRKELESIFLDEDSYLDSEGYITLYHGGVSLPRYITEDKIFFLTSSKREAQDYAYMAGGNKGKVFRLKIKPEDINFNRGSGEFEFQGNAKITNGKIIPVTKLPNKDTKSSVPTQLKTYEEFIQNQDFKSISSGLLRWAYATVGYYFQSNKLNYKVSISKFIKDCGYFLDLPLGSKKLKDFSKSVRVDSLDTLLLELNLLITITPEDIFRK